MDDPNLNEHQQGFGRTCSSPVAMVSGWTPINQPSSSPPQGNLPVESVVKPKKRKSRKKISSEATRESLPTPTRTRKRTKLDPSERSNVAGGLGVSKSQASPAAPYHKGSQRSQIFSTTLSTDQGTDRTGVKSSKALPDVTSSRQDTLHLPRAAVHAPLDLICDADRDARLLAEQDDFSDFGLDDQARATSDEWFADENLQEAGPEWLDAHDPQRKSNQVYHQDTEPDADYDQLVALAESSPPLSQVSGNRVKTDRHNTIEMDQPTIDFPAPCIESSLIGSDISENYQAASPLSKSPGTMIRGPKTPPGKPSIPSHDLQMMPPPKPIAAHEIHFNSDGIPLPFVRRPFPEALLDESPVQGLQNGTVLRTVFRVGEAINAARSKKSLAIVELYARVVCSSRTDFKQNFLFADLFTDKPPYLKGTYGIWKGAKLWEQDANGFLGEGNQGKMCRVVGTLKTKDSGSLHMNVRSIWECTYEDIRTAKGIVCS